MASGLSESASVKLFSPQDLADISPWGVDYIRENAESFGFVKMGRKWVAFPEDIKEAIRGCSTSGPIPKTTTSRFSIKDRSIDSPLAARISEMRSSMSRN